MLLSSSRTKHTTARHPTFPARDSLRLPYYTALESAPRARAPGPSAFPRGWANRGTDRLGQSIQHSRGTNDTDKRNHSVATGPASALGHTQIRSHMCEQTRKHQCSGGHCARLVRGDNFTRGSARNQNTPSPNSEGLHRSRMIYTMDPLPIATSNEQHPTASKDAPLRAKASSP